MPGTLLPLTEAHAHENRAMKLISLSLISITLFCLVTASMGSENGPSEASIPLGAKVCEGRNASFLSSWRPYRQDDRTSFKEHTGHDRLELLAIEGKYTRIAGEVAAMKSAGLSEDDINDALSRSLSLAIQGSSDETIDAILVGGADANGEDRSDIKPILLAATCQDTKAVDLLKMHGANLYATDKQGIDALWVSVVSKDIPMASHLLSIGFDPCKNSVITNSTGKKVDIHDVAQEAGAPSAMLNSLGCAAPRREQHPQGQARIHQG